MADEIKQLINMVAQLKITVEEGFKRIDERFEEIDERFEEIDKRFEEIDKRFEGVDRRFEGIDQRIENLEAAIKKLNSNQIKILNSIKLFERDVRSNQKHIERLEEKESYL